MFAIKNKCGIMIAVLFLRAGKEGTGGAEENIITVDIPKDNFILLSYINTKLRDEYSSLEEFCRENDLSAEDICGRMAQIGFSYDAQANAFK